VASTFSRGHPCHPKREWLPHSGQEQLYVLEIELGGPGNATLLKRALVLSLSRPAKESSLFGSLAAPPGAPIKADRLTRMGTTCHTGVGEEGALANQKTLVFQAGRTEKRGFHSTLYWAPETFLRTRPTKTRLLFRCSPPRMNASMVRLHT